MENRYELILYLSEEDTENLRKEKYKNKKKDSLEKERNGHDFTSGR
jgi:hypothetical protein